MPKPQHLHNLSSAVYTTDLDNQVLTPRTPRSRFERHGAAEEQYDDSDLHVSELQTVPLLSSEPNEDDDHRIPSKKFNRLHPVASCVNVPLIFGTLLACCLFALAVFSYKNPGRLQEYVGAKPPPTKAPVEEVYVPPPLHPPETPSHPSEYVAQCQELSKGFMAHGDYWDKPHMNSMAPTDDNSGEEDEVDDRYRLPEGGRTAVCSKTITYLLDGRVGLLADLALMAQAAALARERNRTFIIDDTYWNRGKWTDHFESHLPLEPGPEPGCRAPHPKDLVACPRTARHWVITAHTSKYHFGHPFSEHYENPYGHQLNRLRPIYAAARKSFVSTIRPNADLGALIRSARHELKELTLSGDSYLAVHIRRGDQYTTAIRNAQNRLPNISEDSIVYLASDSPTAEQEFADAYPGRFFSLRQSQDPILRELASPDEYDQKKFNVLSEKERVRLTKGMVIDFALLSGMWAWKGDLEPTASVCTISSNICKTIAVGLGWEKAFGEVDDMGALDEQRKGWVEIEEKGTVAPPWSAFQIF